MADPAIEDFTIGWICALQEEYEAACRMLDEEFDGDDTAEQNDDNTYVFGRIHKHNVVIGSPPGGRYGTTSATGVAKDMIRSFPKLRFALMVGIGGGAPTGKRDIRLGDVVVSEPKERIGGVIQYDLGRRQSNGLFELTGQLNAPPSALLMALTEMKRRHNDLRKPDRIAEHLTLMGDMPEYARPKVDQLYLPDYEHQGGEGCESCDSSKVIQRSDRLPGRAVTVHYGTIASANSVMKDAKDRDRYAHDGALNVLCFEMEAAGLMNTLPTLVIRGICDYSDSHKNSEWHNYAALAAAAYARELLHVVKPHRVASQPSWGDTLVSQMADLQENLTEVLHHHRSQDEEKLLEWLTPINHTKHQIDKARNRNSEMQTGQWLLESPEFQGWLEASNQTLFCPGIPGAGKTVLTSVVVDYLLAMQSDWLRKKGRRMGVAFIYCDFKQQYEPEQLLASILGQFAANDASALQKVKNLHEDCKLRSRNPSISDILEALNSVISTASTASTASTFIIVDALDECNQHCRDRLLSGIFSLQQKGGANLFATSRHIPEIHDRFGGAQTLEIRAKEEDVRAYVVSCMTKLPRFVTRSPDLQEEMKIGIVKAVDGMFLLAKLHLDSLVGARSRKAFQNALKCLPTGTHAYGHAYDLAMDRIEGQDPNKRELAIQVLSWIACARRHLATEELQHALAVEVGLAALDVSNISEIEDVISVCHGLVTVDRERNIIRLVHYTVQEYFERSQKQRLPVAQDYITSICVTYLSFDAFAGGNCQTRSELRERCKRNLFYPYAAMNWGYHAREASVLPHEAWQFLKSTAKVEASSQVLMASALESFHPTFGDEIEPTRMTALHLAAYFGISKAFETLEDGKFLNSQDAFGKVPISWAIENGHVEVARLILDTYQTDVNIGNEQDQTPLWLAADLGLAPMVKLFLAADGLDVNSADWWGSTPLHVAARRGHETVVELLLGNHAIDVNADADRRSTPLLEAAETGNEGVIKLLLAKEGADVNSRSQFGATPLATAAERGLAGAVKLLLADKRVDPDSRDNSGRTPLSKAAGNGHELVVRLLLAQYAVNIDSADHDGRTPLSWAAESGHQALVKLLLEQGNVDVNSRDINGRTPLVWAIGVEFPLYEQGMLHGLTTQENREELVRLLLRTTGITTETRDENGRTAVSWAAETTTRAVVRILVEEGGANVHSRDNSGQTPLLLAVQQRHGAGRNMIQLKGYSEDEHKYVRYREAWDELKGIIELLLEKGSDPKTGDNKGLTPLFIMERMGWFKKSER